MTSFVGGIVTSFVGGIDLRLCGYGCGSISKIEARHPNTAYRFASVADSLGLHGICSFSEAVFTFWCECPWRGLCSKWDISSNANITCLTKLALSLYWFVPKTQPLLITNFSRSRYTFTEIKYKNQIWYGTNWLLFGDI